MKSIYKHTDNAEIIARIDQLTPASKAQWGKMNVDQMLAHCQVPIKVAFEDLLLKRGLVGFLFGKIAKKKLLGPEGFKPNLPTFKEAKIKETRGFDTEKEQLKMAIARFTAGPDAVTQKPHPFFGPLTKDEWDGLQYKHIDHHLRQFGV